MPAAVLVEKNQESAPVVERARPQKVSRPQKSRTTPTRSTPATKPATKPTATPAKPKSTSSAPKTEFPNIIYCPKLMDNKNVKNVKVYRRNYSESDHHVFN